MSIITQDLFNFNFNNMKNFKNLNFGTEEVLQRSQMKSISGGFGPSAADCDSECGTAGKTCPSGLPKCVKFACTKDDGKKVDRYACLPDDIQ